MSDEVREMIGDYEAAVGLYDAQIPFAEGIELDRLRFHRNWNLEIIASLSALSNRD